MASRSSDIREVLNVHFATQVQKRVLQQPAIYECTASMNALARKRLKRAVAHIKRYPEQWDQDMAVGCPSCLLSHVSRLSGVCADDRRTSSDMFDNAKELLQLTHEQLRYLFTEERTIADFDAFIASDGCLPEDWVPSRIAVPYGYAKVVA